MRRGVQSRGGLALPRALGGAYLMVLRLAGSGLGDHSARRHGDGHEHRAKMSAMMAGASVKKEPRFRGAEPSASLVHSRAFSTSTFSSMEAALVLLRSEPSTLCAMARREVGGPADVGTS